MGSRGSSRGSLGRGGEVWLFGARVFAYGYRRDPRCAPILLVYPSVEFTGSDGFLRIARCVSSLLASSPAANLSFEGVADKRGARSLSSPAHSAFTVHPDHPVCAWLFAQNPQWRPSQRQSVLVGASGYQLVPGGCMSHDGNESTAAPATSATADLRGMNLIRRNVAPQSE